MSARGLAVFSTALLFVSGTSLPARADGLQLVATLSSASGKLLVADYTQGPSTVGLIAVRVGSQTYSYSFDKSEIPALVALWTKAERTDGDKFVAAGSVAETGTHALDVLLLAGGPSVRFSIADPVDGLFSFDLARGDYAAFDAALHKAADAITE
jgi:hypothetical protein